MSSRKSIQTGGNLSSEEEYYRQKYLKYQSKIQKLLNGGDGDVVVDAPAPAVAPVPVADAFASPGQPDSLSPPAPVVSSEEQKEIQRLKLLLDEERNRSAGLISQLSDTKDQLKDLKALRQGLYDNFTERPQTDSNTARAKVAFEKAVSGETSKETLQHVVNKFVSDRASVSDLQQMLILFGNAKASYADLQVLIRAHQEKQKSTITDDQWVNKDFKTYQNKNKLSDEEEMYRQKYLKYQSKIKKLLDERSA